jgi:hypothetical protein
MTTKETLFTQHATGEDVSHIYRVTSVLEKDTLFSNIDIPSLTKQITSLPIEVLPRQDIHQSTLFGDFSEDVDSPPSPASSYLSLPEEVTQRTIDDDLWQHADTYPVESRKVDTWESFGVGRSGDVVRGNPFVTEQDPRVFDELLRRHMNHIYSPNESGTIVDEIIFREVHLSLR